MLNINPLFLLSDDLHTKYDVKYFYTNRLNQDCVENLFSVIRGKDGQRDGPDATQFRTALTRVMVDQVLLTRKAQNCQDDFDVFMCNLKSFADAQPPMS